MADLAAGSDELRPPAGLVGRGPYRYARWDGRQRLPDVSAEELLDSISDDLLADGDVGSALGRLFERGFHGSEPDGGLTGLRELRQRLARAREDALSRYQLGGVLDGLAGELQQIVDAERRGLERRLLASSRAGDTAAALAGEIAGRRRAELDELPAEPGSRLKALQGYDFMEPEARHRFGELMERLRGQVLDSYFAGLSEAISRASPEALAQNRQMVRELADHLIERPRAGKQPAVAGKELGSCLLYTSPSPRDISGSRMPSSA